MKYNENTSIHKVEIGNLIEDTLLDMVEEGKISKDDGYRWVGVDENGRAYCYNFKPLKHNHSWLFSGNAYDELKLIAITLTEEQLAYIEANWQDLLFEIGEKG